MFLSDFNQIWTASTDFLNSLTSHSTKIHLVGAELTHPESKKQKVRLTEEMDDFSRVCERPARILPTENRLTRV